MLDPTIMSSHSDVEKKQLTYVQVNIILNLLKIKNHKFQQIRDI